MVQGSNLGKSFRYSSSKNLSIYDDTKDSISIFVTALVPGIASCILLARKILAVLTNYLLYSLSTAI